EAGEYPVTATLSGTGYETLTLTATLAVTPRAVTVTAADRSKVFGETDPELTYTATPALVGSDAFTGGLARDAGEAPGDYAITEGTLAAGGNYTVTFVAGTFTITPATITGITLDDGSFAYDGTAHALAIVGTLPDGVTVSYTGNDQTEVGEYPVTATLSGTGYETLTLTATLTIGKVHITGITCDDGTFTYDGTAHALAIAGTLPDGVTVSYEYNDGLDVGDYSVKAFVLGSDIFLPLELTATLTITPATRSITFPERPDKAYGDDQFDVRATTVSGEEIIYTSSNEDVIVIEDGKIRIV